MKTLAAQIITTAAQAAGMDPARVRDKAVMAEAMQAVPRLELTYLPERLEPRFRRFQGTPVPGQPLPAAHPGQDLQPDPHRGGHGGG